MPAVARLISHHSAESDPVDTSAPLAVDVGNGGGTRKGRRSPDDWGSLRDGRSKIGRVCSAIRADLGRRYMAKSPEAKRNLDRAARLLAEVERISFFPEAVGSPTR